MTETTQTKKGNNRIVVIILVVVVLILLGAVAFLMLGGTAMQLLGGGGTLPEDEFIVRMDQFPLRPNDMDDPYSISAGGDLRMDNTQLSKFMGSGYVKPFVNHTGRVDGWDVSLDRVNANAFGPETVRSQVSYFEEADGASEALSSDWFWAYQLEDRAPEEFLDENCSLGSDCVTFMYKEVKPGGGSIVERYDVAFRYKNVVIWVFVKGVQGEVSEDIVMDYGQMVLDKVKLLDS
ncbi:MAG TPA: hypothetical protein VJ965_10205 [Anaerolineales bacterium]|nr:hypothetical protein [Anaerolineales bacterium]